MPMPSTSVVAGSLPPDPAANASLLAGDFRVTVASTAVALVQPAHDDSLLIEALEEIQRARLALDALLEAGVSEQWAA